MEELQSILFVDDEKLLQRAYARTARNALRDEIEKGIVNLKIFTADDEREALAIQGANPGLSFIATTIICCQECVD